MDKIDRIIIQLTELTKNNKIQWKHKFEDYAVCEDFPSVEFVIFLGAKMLCFHNKTVSGGRLYTPQVFNALSPVRDLHNPRDFNTLHPVLELCKAVEGQIGEKAEGEPEEKNIIDVCLDDIADFKSRS